MIPTVQSTQFSGSTLYIIFNRAIAANSGTETAGVTVTINGTPTSVTFSSITQNALIVTLGSTPALNATVVTSYNASLGSLRDAAVPTDLVANFSSTAVNYFSQPSPFQATVGVGGNNRLSIQFTAPVGATDANLLAGFTVLVNAVPVSLTGATAALSANQATLTLVLASNFSYSSVVSVQYDSGPGTLFGWPVGSIGNFTLTAINLSTDGLPTSAYPLSWVTRYPLSPSDNIVTAKVSVSLNPIDRQLVLRYGPALVYTGGIFGVTIANPAGVPFIGTNTPLKDGVELTGTFVVPGNTPFATAAGLDWLNVITVRIQQVLGGLRLLDQSVTLGPQTVTAV